jgi:hypothetical protein
MRDLGGNVSPERVLVTGFVLELADIWAELDRRPARSVKEGCFEHGNVFYRV